MSRIILFLCFLFLLTSGPVGNAKVFFGISIPESLLDQKNRENIAAQNAHNPLLKARKKYVIDIEKKHPFESKHVAFALVIGLISYIGLFRMSNRSYFRNTFRAFRNASLSNRQLKEQLQQNSVAGLMLDLFFCCSAALYIYYVMAYFHYDRIASFSKLSFIGGIALLLIIIYTFRFLFLKIAGWLFQVPEIMGNYSFQIFLINKILGVLLVPFIAVLAFGQGSWVQVSLFLSLLLIGLLILYRYIRAWAVFQYFLKFSKFHFFMYLCASEILPLAILIKLLSSVWLTI